MSTRTPADFDREIALTLGLADETVKTHVARVLAKLQVENRAQAIVQALKRGLVTLGRDFLRLHSRYMWSHNPSF